MGAYLSRPITHKETEEGENSVVEYATCAMQGWRLGMEDSHSVILDIDKDLSFFGVFDGHGGAEVARFCGKHMHEEFIKSYKPSKGDIAQVLINTFLRMDELLLLDENQEELRSLIFEAEKNISYSPVAKSPTLSASPSSPCPLPPSTLAFSSASSDPLLYPFIPSNISNEDDAICVKVGEIDCTHPIDDCKKDGIEGPLGNIANNSLNNKVESIEAEDLSRNSNAKRKLTLGETSHPKRDIKDDELDDGEDEEDEDYHPENSDESDGTNDYEEEEDEDEYEKGVNEMEEDEDGVIKSCCKSDGDTISQYKGPSSGCTAVVAILNGNRLYVANAGDSRCVISRNGNATELSLDHKPELDEERKRIIDAGGFIEDGRINGCLNLSRAIGDMEYKQNSSLKPSHQIVTAFPDIKTYEINENDEFLILACDGIWDVLTSQQAVNFVHSRMDKVPLSKITHEIFDCCIAPDTTGEGVGLDNMSMILIKFKNHKSKQQGFFDD